MQGIQQNETNRRTKVGKVISTKMQKTVVVAVDHIKRHQIYKKPMHLTHKFKAHDELNECKDGDIVRILESRPLSKEKRWRVVEIIQKGIQL